MPELEETVHRALDNAVDNGYRDFVFNSPIPTVVDDLMTYDSDCQNMDSEVIAKHVRSWREKNERR